MLKIIDIDVDSMLAEDVRPGDGLISIDGEAVRDILDYHFLSAGEEFEIEFERAGERFIIEVEKEDDEPLGMHFPEMKPRTCGNNCIFCFVDQFPPGARKTLCVKDEDYRFSFLHGNFITLSNLGRRGIARIIRYRLSPLYISVHALDKEIRNRLLGRTKDDGFLLKFRALATGGISMHTQIVVIPGLNDGFVLQETIEKLGKYYPSVASIGIIPIGLTRYRDNLPELRLLTEAECGEIASMVDLYRERFTNDYDDPLIYCADEIFLKAGLQIPETEYYGEFPQIENGIGLVRDLLDRFAAEKPDFPRILNTPLKILMPAGRSIYQVIRSDIEPVLNAIAGMEVEVIPVDNRFFGDSVSVSGLLTGGDILQAISGHTGDLVLLPPDCLNYDDLFLDDMSLEEFSKRAGMEARKFTWSFRKVLT